MTHVYIKRIKNGIDYGTVDIPEKNLQETLKLNPEWKVVDSKYLEEEKIQPPKVVLNELECPLCGKICGNKVGLLSHKKSHK